MHECVYLITCPDVVPRWSQRPCHRGVFAVLGGIRVWAADAVLAGRWIESRDFGISIGAEEELGGAVMLDLGPESSAKQSDG